MELAEVIATLKGMPPAARTELEKAAIEGTAHLRWIPSPGPQTLAYNSKADILLFGGEPGGGKSQLLLGLAFNCHENSLIMRRQYTDLDAMIEGALHINGGRSGFNGSPPPSLRHAKGKIDFGAAARIGDEQHWMGRPHDFLGIDEATQFAAKQIRFLRGWLRSTKPGQRVRTVLATNPPLSADGLWVHEMFSPWLNPQHPNPAQPGELRWFVVDETDHDVEVSGPGVVNINGRDYDPESRTFIPSALSDNPFLSDTDYQKRLDSLPAEVRNILLGGFATSFVDAEFQTIPTDWIRQAQGRWKPKPPEGIPMCAIGVDVAQGGCFDDQTEILTDSGWMLFEHLSGTERVLTLNGMTAEWGSITQLHRYKHVGPMNLMQRPDLSFCITDNHQLLAKSQHGSWTLRRYDKLPQNFYIPRSIDWVGNNPLRIKFESRLTMPHGGDRIKQWDFCFEDWARLLGWFVSEGCAFQEKRLGRRWRINIAQNKGAKMDRIKTLLRRMKIQFHEPKSRSSVEFSIASIGAHLAEHCGVHAENKRIPEYIRNATPLVIRAFLEEYCLGDGSVNGTGVSTYSTTSKMLADDLQEVLTKLGRAGKMRVVQKAGSKFKIGTREVVRKRDTFNVTERSVLADCYIQKSNVQRVSYDGMVYCVSTPLKTICVRRNGSVMWSGNSDQTILAPRYDGWYAPLIAIPGKQTPFGRDVAGAVIAHRRHDAVLIIDMGGGYGGAALEHLRENLGSDVVIGYKGAEGSTARTSDRQLPFYNRRSQAYWKFREALDPSQLQGSPIMLPDDPELVADLTAPTFEIGSRGIQVEPKEDVVKRLGRSCDRGDAVVMAWTNGSKLPTHYHEWRADQQTAAPGRRGGTASVNLGPRRSGRH